MSPRKPSLSAILGNATREAHSPLYLVMREHYEEMMAAFAGKRPNWPVLIQRFADLGIMDGNGKPPTLRGAQATWYRVKRDMERQAAEPARLSRPSSMG
jgi:hypothetical protein